MCTVPSPPLAEGIKSNPTAGPCSLSCAMGRHGLWRLVSLLTAEVIYNGNVQINAFLVAWGNPLHRLSHVVLSALRFHYYCRLVLPSSVPLHTISLTKPALQCCCWNVRFTSSSERMCLALQLHSHLWGQAWRRAAGGREAGRVFLDPLALVNSASGPATGQRRGCKAHLYHWETRN